MPDHPYDEQYLWPKVDPAGDCWQWTAARDKGGYGLFSYRVREPGGRRQRQVMAHRAVWEVLVGAIPDGLTLDHRCRNRCCVNPDHLEPVTGRINGLRGYSVAAKNARKLVCDHGHDLTDPDNVYPLAQPGGGRGCRKCRRAFTAAYKAAHSPPPRERKPPPPPREPKPPPREPRPRLSAQERQERRRKLKAVTTRQWREAHPEAAAAFQRKSYLAHREARLAAAAAYREANREEINAKQRARRIAREALRAM